MRFITTIISLFLYISYHIVIADTVRGASPDLQASLKSHSCVLRDTPRKPAVTIPLDRINDNYCDCQDGSDEPGTAACPSATFWCRNSKYVPSMIPSAWVDDGHCDCCDGSDESPGKCSDRCEKLRGEAQANATKSAAVIMKGVKKRASYVEQARVQMEKDKKEIKKLETELKQLESKLKESQMRAELLRKQRDLEESVKEVTQNSDPSSTETDNKNVGDNDYDEYSEGFGNPDDGNHERYDDDDITEDELDDEDSDDENDSDYHEDTSNDDSKTDTAQDDSSEDNPENVQEPDAETGGESEDIERLDSDDIEIEVENDEETDSVTESDNNNIESMPHIDEIDTNDIEQDVEIETKGEETSTEQKEPVEEDIDAVCAGLESSGSNIMLRKLSYVRTMIIYKLHRLLPKLIKPIIGKGNEKLNECVNKADNEKWNLESQKTELERKIRELKDKENIDFGSNLALRKLHGNCVKSKLMQYEFEHCPFDLVRQYEFGSPIAVLGKFRKWEQNGDSAVMVYSGGDQCWNGPSRSTKVILTCGETEEIIAVDEPNRCSYSMKFKTPAVCEKSVADSIISQFDTSDKSKDEL